jgi:hypothetical protein
MESPTAYTPRGTLAPSADVRVDAGRGSGGGECGAQPCPLQLGGVLPGSYLYSNCSCAEVKAETALLGGPPPPSRAFSQSSPVRAGSGGRPAALGSTEGLLSPSRGPWPSAEEQARCAAPHSLTTFVHHHSSLGAVSIGGVSGRAVRRSKGASPVPRQGASASSSSSSRGSGRPPVRAEVRRNLFSNSAPTAHGRSDRRFLLMICECRAYLATCDDCLRNEELPKHLLSHL